VSEFTLLNLLRERHAEFQTDRADPICLFRQHFILFHSLYRLQQQLLEQKLAHLEINPLSIELHPYQPHKGDQLAQPDSLRDYYLDLDQLRDTGAQEVEALLNRFWTHILRNERRQEALAILGLRDPVDDAAIRRRYRELAMLHHPDRINTGCPCLTA
jgi:DnaJ-domain-containing protein 1